jgi:hypothetical protein
MALSGCADEAAGLELLAQPIVYGVDGRTEYHAIEDPLSQTRMSQSTVALISNEWIDRRGGRISTDAPTWGVRDDICPEEPFADQPGIAFCTGVLVDWDLVLTAGHCVRLFALADFSVVFGYYYVSPGELAVGQGDIATPVEIVSEALDPEGVEPRLDYAWLRLADAVKKPLEPAWFYGKMPPLDVGDPIVTIGSANGVPLKFDATGSVRGLRVAADYFIADTDTSAGWSGGGGFDERLALLGILSRGGLDLSDSPSGCQVSVRISDEDPAEEHFSYVSGALDGLCANDPTRSICRADCPEPCQAAAPGPRLAMHGRERGCSMVRAHQPFGMGAMSIILSVLLRWKRRASTRAQNYCSSGGST